MKARTASSVCGLVGFVAIVEVEDRGLAVEDTDEGG
jgi:hypothetical protein